MPFKVIKQSNCYKIVNLKTNKITNPCFKTKQKAENQAKNWMRYSRQNHYKNKKNN